MNTQLAQSLPVPNDSLFAQSRADRDALLEAAIRQYQASSSANLSTQQVEQLQNNARAIANRILQSDPGHIEALNILARIDLDCGNLSGASQWVATALALEKGSATSWYTYGQVELAKGQLGSAETAFIRCIELDPRFFRAHTSYAYTKLQQGQLVPAFEHYRKLTRVQPNDAHVRAKLFECLRQLRADYDNRKLADDLCGYLSWDDVNHNDLATICATLLSHRYQLASDDTVLDIAALAADPLVLLALQKLFFTDPLIESVFSAVRAHLLLSELFQPAAANRALVVALGCQAFNSEYVHSYSDDEAALVDELSEKVARYTLADVFKSQHQLALLAMYRPLSTVLSPQVLLHIKPEQWLQDYLPVMERCIHQPRNIASFSNFTTVGKISNPVSCAVREQYESNPYPRWLALDYHTPTTYAQALQNALSGFRAPAWLQHNPLNILVAGCGTGRQALQIARYFRNSQVVAVDISRASLQYAGQMALNYGLQNVQFIQADILELDQLDMKFHIIECSGVLHHMGDPLHGARHLQQLLLPGGLLKLGLYSERARAEVVKARALIADQHLDASPASIRAFRQFILNAGKTEFPNILFSPDFYTMSGCRDLLFHVQEHRFTPLQLQSMVDALGMRFLGFSHIPVSARQNYRSAYPHDPHLLDLQCWDEFEGSNPATFGAMYQFYLQ